MNHRIVSGVLAFLLLLFVTAALLFAVGVRPLRPPGDQVSARLAPVPHELSGAYAACRDCHAHGGGAAVPPGTHRKFRLNTCSTCHHSAPQGT
jgi:hypothetical protein